MSKARRLQSRRFAIQVLESRQLLAANLWQDISQLEQNPVFAEAPVSPWVPPLVDSQQDQFADDGSKSIDKSGSSDFGFTSFTVAAQNDNGSDGGGGFPSNNDGGTGGGGFSLLNTTMDDLYNLQSKPDSNYTLFLDFDGHITEGTHWNNRAGVDSIIDYAYNRNSNITDFSQSERNELRRIWQGVAEDFAPFDVNVTTVDPGVDALRRTDPDDNEYGLRVVMTDRNVTCGGCGGIAYITSFRWGSDTPAFSFNKGVIAAASTVSHEAGHGLYLSHDGDGGNSYYSGHGSGATQWAPIMGAGWDRVDQFDQGEYFNHNNNDGDANYGQGNDDLEVITSNFGFGYRSDDHSDSTAGATQLSVVGGTQLSEFGIIETNTDIDYFKFEVAAGQLNLDIEPMNDRPNLDIFAAIYDENEELVAHSIRPNDLRANFNSIDLEAGTYFLRVEGVGSHTEFDPETGALSEPNPEPWTTNNPVGYSDYGSLGQYWITGSVTNAMSNQFSIAAADAVKPEGSAGEFTPYTFTVSRAGAIANPASVGWEMFSVDPEVQGGTYLATYTTADFIGATGGTIDFLEGESEKTITVEVRGDADVESDEYFAIQLSPETAGWGLNGSTAVGTILNDERVVMVRQTNLIETVIREADTGGTTDHTFTLARRGDVSEALTVNWSINVDVYDYKVDPNDFVGGVLPSGTVTFDPDVTEVQVTVTTVGDELFEENEDFDFQIDMVSDLNTLIDPVHDSARGQITNNDSLVSFEVEAVSAFEGNLNDGELTFTMTRIGDFSKSIDVPFNVVPSGENPVSAADFAGGELPGGTITFPVGSSEASFTMGLASDLITEEDETFIVLIDTGGFEFDNGSLTGTILDDEPEGIDFGDAPASYGTLYGEDGAGHLSFGGVLGADRTNEVDANPVTAANSDADDGVAFTSEFAPDANGTLDVTVSEDGFLDAWIDFDASGTFESEESIFASPISTGTTELTIAVPADAVEGISYARFRFSSEGGLSPTGLAADGEVEDYALAIGNPFSVSDIGVNAGDVQRSLLTQLNLDFGDEFDLPADPTEAITVTERVSGEEVNLSITTEVIDEATVATIKFLSGNHVTVRDGGSPKLNDGDYVLTLDWTKVKLAGFDITGFGDYKFGEERADMFYALYGDANQDETVNLLDVGMFRTDYRNSVDPDSRFDSNGDGTVNLLEVGELRSNYRTSRADW